MRYVLKIAVCAVVLASAVPASADDAADIRAANQRWTQSMKAKDMASIQQIVGPEFALMWGAGTSSESVQRAQWLANLEGMTFNEYRVDIEDLDVRGDVALATIDGNWTVTNARGTRKEPFKLRDVWVRRPGGWQVVSRYVIGE